MGRGLRGSVEGVGSDRAKGRKGGERGQVCMDGGCGVWWEYAVTSNCGWHGGD